MSHLICRKTMLQCPTPSMCSPYGGCIDPLAAQLKNVVINQEVRRFVGQDDRRKIDELVAEGIEVDKREIARLKAENERLRETGAALVKGIDDWNEAMQKVIGEQPGYRWPALEDMRDLVGGKR